MTAKTQRFTDFFAQAVRDLPQRTREILAQRYGIDPQSSQTLGAIGERYGLTRERIRQIIADGVRTVRQSTRDNKEIYAPLEEAVCARGKIIPEEELLDAVSSSDHRAERGAARFFVDASENLRPLKRKDVVKAVVHVEFDEEQWTRVKEIVTAILSDVKEPLAHEILHKQYTKHPEADTQVDAETLHHYLTPVTDIAKNPFGRWGLTQWSDVRPRSMRDRIYLVLKEKGAPMHFRDIAAAIDAHGLSRGTTRTNIQTVHNELIKDQRFVLVGRGMYALRDWGYVPGTVRDVITQVLKEHGAPMAVRDVVAAVEKKRDVRKMTVLVNLNQHFKKVRRGVYTLPEEEA